MFSVTNEIILKHACVLYHSNLGHLSRHYFSQTPSRTIVPSATKNSFFDIYCDKQKRTYYISSQRVTKKMGLNFTFFLFSKG